MAELSARSIVTVVSEKGGGLAQRPPKLLEMINKTMKESCWLIFKGLTECEVISSELGNSAGVLGAIRKVHKVLEK